MGRPRVTHNLRVQATGRPRATHGFAVLAHGSLKDHPYVLSAEP